MTVLVLQHAPAEGPVLIASALLRAGCDLRVWRVDDDEPVPRPEAALDALVVMGGPQSAYDDTGFPTRRGELALIADAVERGVAVLGVCLGAQLLAHACDGRSVPGRGPEVGWADVSLTPAAAGDALLAGLPDRFPVLHWHGDTYEPPAGAVHLARSAAYDQQAFRLGDRAWGLQFHVEVDEATVRAFVGSDPRNAAAAPGGEVALLRDTAAALTSLAPTRDAVLCRFADLVAGG